MSSKTKYWFFYITDEEVAKHHETLVNDIYAFTDKKKLADSFKSIRNMSVFYTKTEKLDRGEISELIKHYMLCELESFKGTTKGKGYSVKKFTIALTRQERQLIRTRSSILLHEEIFYDVWGDASVFKKKYRKCLKALRYFDFQKYLTEGEATYEGNIYSNDLTLILDSYRDLFIGGDSINEAI